MRRIEGELECPGKVKSIACGQNWVAASCHGSKYITLWQTERINDSNSEPDLFITVKDDAGAQALAFGPTDLLCTFSSVSKELILWRIGSDMKCTIHTDLSQALSRSNVKLSDHAAFGSKLVFQDPSCSFAGFLALVVGATIVVVNFHQVSVHAVFQANQDESVSCLAFCTLATGENAIIALLEDESFQLWNLVTLNSVHIDNEKLVGVPRCLAGGNELPFVFVGSGNGTAVCLSLEHAFKEENPELIQVWQVSFTEGGEQDDCMNNAIAMQCHDQTLWIGFPARVITIDTASQTVTGEFIFQSTVCDCTAAALSSNSILLAAPSYFSNTIQLTTLMDPEIPLVSEEVPETQMEEDEKCTDDETLVNSSEMAEHAFADRIRQEEASSQVNSTTGREEDADENDDDVEDEVWSFFPDQDPPENSPLRTPPYTRPKGKPSVGKSKGTLDKPVTFHSRIRSSGYGSTPPKMALFGVKSKKSAKVKGSRGIGTALLARIGEQRMYPSDCSIINELVKSDAEVEAKLLHPSAVLKVKHSQDGAFLATCSTDKTARVIRLPLGKYKGEGYDFVGHREVVNSIDFSHSANLVKNANLPARPLFLTGSSDGTAKMWSMSLSSPLVTFAPSKATNNVPSSQLTPVSQATFFYMDKFVLIASGPQLRLHQFVLDEETLHPVKDIKAQQKKNQLKTKQSPMKGSLNQKLVKTWDCQSHAQAVTSFAAMNSFLSNLVIVATSDRSISVLDAAADKQSHFFSPKSSSERAAHTLVLPSNCIHASHPNNAFDMFLSCSTEGGGCISVWDLRARDRVMKLMGHKNRVQSTGASISPCMRYVATGSEDNSCYLFDLRKCDVAERLWDSHKDTVAAVSFHPIIPQLATACFDGRIRFYRSSAS